MIGQIGPLVQAGAHKQAMALHVLGGVAGGIVLGVPLAVIGAIVNALMPAAGITGIAVLVGASLLILGSVDAGIMARPYLEITRQTPQNWACAMGREPAALAWGFDLALLFTTRIPFQSALALPLLVVLLDNPLAAVSVCMTYGAVRAAAAMSVVWIARSRFPRFIAWAHLRSRTVRSMAGFSGIITGAAVLMMFNPQP